MHVINLPLAFVTARSYRVVEIRPGENTPGRRHSRCLTRQGIYYTGRPAGCPAWLEHQVRDANIDREEDEGTEAGAAAAAGAVCCKRLSFSGGSMPIAEDLVP
jgi:hypothetical protein